MRKSNNYKWYMLVRLNNYRPNGSALANIHKDISAEISELVDTFVSTKPRREADRLNKSNREIGEMREPNINRDKGAFFYSVLF